MFMSIALQVQPNKIPENCRNSEATLSQFMMPSNPLVIIIPTAPYKIDISRFTKTCTAIFSVLVNCIFSIPFRENIKIIKAGKLPIAEKIVQAASIKGSGLLLLIIAKAKHPIPKLRNVAHQIRAANDLFPILAFIFLSVTIVVLWVQ